MKYDLGLGNVIPSDHPTIANFWSVFHDDFNLEEEKKFLLFLTGCDRIPVGGMKSLSLKIQVRLISLALISSACIGKAYWAVLQRSAETKHLPVAHTCFNLLDLPDYSTREKLKYMLLKAIQYTHGFGLA